MKSRSRSTASATSSAISSNDAGSNSTPQPASLPLSQQQIEQIAQRLTQLPQKQQESWSIREAIAYLHLPITTALTKGYSREEIAAMMRTAGIAISDASLKYYLLQLSLQTSSIATTNTTPTRQSSTTSPVRSPRTPSTLYRSVDNTADLSSTNSPHLPRNTVEDVISYLISDL